VSILFAYFDPDLLMEALTAGAIIGALAGIVVFTADSAAEGIRRVILGLLIGGIIMGVFQAIRIGSALGFGFGTALNPLLEAGSGPFGALVFEAIVWTMQAAFAGGIFMVVSLAPFNALKGGLAGAVIGIVAALISWGLLQFVDAAVPLVIFYILVLGIVLFIVDNLPVRG
jgi:hypothetical protein